ncbi:MAG: undecaprenyl/decaprenyl-phosphate alpha-N-acetylglucosaminyl 1-phosphate transferase [Syntrophus sp. (in: bacteria)]|nr:undecaprenyl/decaprenyl-phosphate alpha-N-acetylglucosaminyl 1-phosphate transferase [Syntrophus sp. (in: bacteria)]
MIYISALLLSFFITISLIPLSMRIAGRIKAIDFPDERKVHTEPTPRIGGIAIAIGVFVSMLIWTAEDNFLRAYAIGAGIIVLFGIIDDLKGLNYKVKFSGQIAAALVVVFYGGLKITKLGTILPDNTLLPLWASIPVTVILIVGITNAINLADGLDGLAGGVCLLSFCCIGYLAFLEGNTAIALLSLSLIGAIFGFLRFNTYPASLFMGDAGSQFLGFSLVTISVALTQGNTVLSPVLPLIIFGFPVLDTATVMLNRIAEGRSPFSADKHHLHHRLMDMGLWHTEAVFVIYVIQALFVAAAFIFRFYSEWMLFIIYGLFANLIIAAFFIVAKTGFTLKRRGMFDTIIKDRLRVLKEKGLFIIIFFRIIEFGIPLLMFATCFLPRAIPTTISLFSSVLMVTIVVVWCFKKTWLPRVLALSLYLLIPIVVYLSTDHARLSEFNHYVISIYNFFFVFLVFFVVLTLKFTRRRRGFKATTMDFLIFFVALVAPYIAGAYTEYKEVGGIAAKMIMLFFSYEVLIGELRDDINGLTFATVCSLILITARGFLGA